MHYLYVFLTDTHGVDAIISISQMRKKKYIEYNDLA